MRLKNADFVPFWVITGQNRQKRANFDGRYLGNIFRFRKRFLVLVPHYQELNISKRSKVWTYMIGFSETNQSLFTELKKLDPLGRYRASTVAKTRDFHTLAKFVQM